MFEKDIDILSYRPDLTINKKVNVDKIDIADINSNINSSVNSSSSFTSCFESFKEHCPSVLISKIKYVDTLINKTIKKTEELISSNPAYISYKNSTDEERQVIVEENFNNMTSGSTAFEVYVELETIKDFVSDINSLSRLYFFGDSDISDEEALSIEEEAIKKISIFESINKVAQVNYFSLNVDSKIIFLLEKYLEKMEQILYAEIVYSELVGESVNPTLETILLEEFESINKLLTSDIYKNKKNYDNFKIVLKNVFIDKQNLNNLIDEITDGVQNGISSTCHKVLSAAIDSHEKKLDESINNLVQVVLMSEVAESDVFDTISKKSDLRNALS